jgi:benzoyl-CoA reductase/2-hydroxyglutaryl-CoA dehydratase subunit BcrC/BadD/HgdB
VFGQNGQKLLELTARATSVRDLWVQTLEELCLPGQAEQSDEDTKQLNEKLEKQQEKQKEVRLATGKGCSTAHKSNKVLHLDSNTGKTEPRNWRSEDVMLKSARKRSASSG